MDDDHCPGHTPAAAAIDAAWAIQIELSTRVGPGRLPHDCGLVREELACLHSLFTTTRASLSPIGLGAEQKADQVHQVAERLREQVLRPFLNRWHPLLAAHEATRFEGEAMADHEARWEHNGRFRAELAALAVPLGQINAELSEITGGDLELAFV